MDLQIILHNTECGKTEFQLSQGVRPWGILMLIRAGQYTLSFPETGYTCTVHPHEITFIPPNTPFIRRVDMPIDFHQFNFLMNWEHPFAQALRPGILHLPQTQMAALEQSLSLSTQISTCSELIQYELQHILKENFLFAGQSPADLPSEDIRRVISYMEEHIAEKIDMDTLAAMAFLSRTGLIWKFHQQLDSTPQQVLIQLRMRLAKQLLLETDLSITQIAQQCGYANGYYFSNAFHSNTGMSPSAFRNFYLKK